MQLGEWVEDGASFVPKYVDIEEVLGEFFGIDSKAAEDERAALLKTVQEGDSNAWA
jgi:hypothetical protein